MRPEVTSTFAPVLIGVALSPMMRITSLVILLLTPTIGNQP